MERTRGSVRLRYLGFWLNCCLLAGCLGLWPAWRTPGQAPGALARLADTWTGVWGSGSLDGHLDGAWGSGSLGGHLDRCLSVWVSARSDLEKVPAFFYFAGTFFDAKPIEAHRGFFHCAIWLDAGTFDSKISYRPANKLTDTARNCLFPCFQHWFRPQQAYFTKYSLINPST